MRFSGSKLCSLVLVLASLAIPVLFASQAYAHSGDVFSAFTSTPPVIDGTMSAGEWSDADSVDITVNVPGGGTTPGTIFVMNDGTNLFLALRYEASVDNNVLQFRFDNNHDGVRQLGEDGLSVFEFASFDLFFNSGNEPLDASSGGTNDISGAFGDDGTSSVFELSHPLDSADDAHDFSLSPGDTTGVQFVLSLTEIIDVSFANTFYPSISVDPSTWADIVIAAPVEAPVGGEIIPTSAVSLFVAGAAANAFWIIPAIGGAASAAIYGIVRARK